MYNKTIKVKTNEVLRPNDENKLDSIPKMLKNFGQKVDFNKNDQT